MFNIRAFCIVHRGSCNVRPAPLYDWVSIKVLSLLKLKTN